MLDIPKVVKDCGRYELDELNVPGARGIAITNNGEIFVTSSTTNSVYVFSQTELRQIGIIQGTIRHEGDKRVVPFQQPHGIYIDDDDIYVAELGGNRVRVLTTKDILLHTYGSVLQDHPDAYCYGNFQFSSPHDVKIGPNGKVYVVDRGNDCIKVFDKDGSNEKVHGLLPFEISHPEGIVFHDQSCFCVTGYGSRRFAVFNHTTSNENIIWQFISPKMENINPKGIAIDKKCGYTLITAAV